MGTVKIFIASSAELEKDRKAFRELLSEENDKLHYKGVYLELVQWECFPDSVSKTSKQDDYNEALKTCDLVICLFYTKAGKYTQQEFDTALKQFSKKGAPLIYTYFKEPEGAETQASVTNDVQVEDAVELQSRQDLVKFKERLAGLGHFVTKYTSTDNLKLKFLQQLDFLQDKGFEKLQGDLIKDTREAVTNYINNINNANVLGDNNTVVQGENNTVTITHTTYINPIARNPNKKPTNYFLCRSLMEALKEYNTRAERFLDSTVDDSDKDTWQNQEDNYLPKAKTIINESFASIMGDFIFNVCGSGNQKDYFDVTLLTTKRMLQLLCYTYISSLWDQQKDLKQPLSPELLKYLNKIFYAGIEQNISLYADLLKSLLILFQEPKFNNPIPESISLFGNFSGDSTFMSTCKKLDDYRTQYVKDQTMPEVEEIEKQLTSFLVSLAFMAKYKMISIKNIGYEALRNNPAQYVHAYNTLGVNKSPIYKLQDSPINNDSVVLFKDKYENGINLFPFIIDMNALKDQKEVKICFYASYDENDKALTYYDTDKTSPKDNSGDVKIEFNKELISIQNDLKQINSTVEREITDFKEDNGKKYQLMKMYEVYTTFEEAKQSFLPD